MEIIIKYAMYILLIIALLVPILVGIYEIYFIIDSFKAKPKKTKEFDTRPKIEQLNEVFNGKGK